ncbi:MAG: nitrilase-related carbon-nitrogen hydrolase, partial [Pseudomonadota bacterium]
LMMLPEMFTTGFSMNPEQFAETSNGKALQQMKKWAAKKNAAVCGSMMFNDLGKYYNRLVWMLPDGNFFQYDKKHLFSLGDENNHYTSGKSQLVVPYKGWDVKLLICYDLRFPVWCRNKKDFDLLIFVANWPEKRTYAWKQLLIARAIENQCYVAAVNRVGTDKNEVYHCGESMLIDPKGEVMESVLHQEKIITSKISYAYLQQIRNDFPFLKDADAFSIQ